MSQLPKDIIAYIKQLEARVQALERTSQIKNITIPSGGKFVLDVLAADPPVQNGRMYYNSTSNKIRKCEGGTWKNLESA